MRKSKNFKPKLAERKEKGKQLYAWTLEQSRNFIFFLHSVDVDMVLAKHADSMLRERDRLLTEVNETTRRLEIMKATIEDIEKKRMDLENKNKELCKILDVS